MKAQLDFYSRDSFIVKLLVLSSTQNCTRSREAAWGRSHVLTLWHQASIYISHLNTEHLLHNVEVDCNWNLIGWSLSVSCNYQL